MATPYSSPHKLATQNPFSVPLAIFITFFLLLGSKVNSIEILSFNFTNFQDDDSSLTLQGDANIASSGTLELTNPSTADSTGRALYAEPLHLWDSSTGEVANFVTSFSFVVEDIPGYDISDGIAFFLAPNGSQIPSNSGGKNLGIVDGQDALNQVVAVEFDSHYRNNPHDPRYIHIGIDVNSVRSLETVEWQRESGALVKVSIVYDSLSKTLSVLVTYPSGLITTIAQVINLKAVLPEWVSFGFSATSVTDYRERHDVYSWSFTSILQSSSAKKDWENVNIARYA